MEERLRGFHRGLYQANEELSLDQEFFIHKNSFGLGYDRCGIEFSSVEKYLVTFRRWSCRKMYIFDGDLPPLENWPCV